MIYFTSDTHFNQERTLRLSKRPFKTIDEMNEKLIENWNKTVGEDDIVYHLGDFGDYNFAKKLNGKIILVKGNYERHDMIPSIILKHKYGFSEVYNYIDNEYINGYYISMVHEPSRLKDMEISDKKINLFGHIHKLQMAKRCGLNVGSDCHNFTPVSFDDMLFWHNAIVNYYNDEVFDQKPGR